jgi:hypothetical protein
METTNPVFDLSLYNKLKPETLMSWIRVVVANRMAHNGSDWARIFALSNSGTYNNQWIIVDYKLYTPGTGLTNGTLWILEQIPGYTESADVTQFLRTQGYWPSYNVPYFPNIYNITGTRAAFEKYGNVWSYDRCPRANIFRRDQAKGQDMPSMQRLMRSNDYKNDPFSLDCPAFQLASRADLAPITPRPDWGNACRKGPHGATNGKITSAHWAKSDSRAASCIVGPTSQSLAPFSWKDWPAFSRVGMPDVFNFNWVTLAARTPPPSASADE